MILKTALVLLYLLIGLWLFVATVNKLGGRRSSGYDDPLVYVLGMITVTVSWPLFVLYGLFRIFRR